ncbi:MAG TPA: chorismate synthase, partial [Candidatus Cloacimonadota bacterium]|nr:chorismate synthase [Candidatus Cloacimonadota bacterium]
MKASKQIEYKENPLYWSDWNTLETVNEYLDNIKESGNSVGAIVEMTIDNLPSGLGDPVFEKLDANVAKAIISIGGVKGIEFGDGFILGSLTGEESNDPINSTGFSSNHMGGILGGISTGQKLILRYVTKPTPSIRRKQKTVNSSNEEVEFQLDGRFDTCIAPRVIPVAEAMTKLVLADAIAYQRLLEGEPTELSHLREAIDKVDEDILIAIYRRFEIVKQIRALKIEEIIPLEDPVRESQLMERLILIGKEWGIGEKKIQSIWKEIIQSGKSP